MWLTLKEDKMFQKEKNRSNWLDKTIGFVNPRSEYERLAWRNALSGYDSASYSRPNSGWTVVNSPAEQVNQTQRHIIRARARDLERNSDIAEAIISNLERNVVGSGIKVQPKVIKTDGTEDEVLNIQIETLWKNWCRARNCDITGQQSFVEMQRMIVRRKTVDGGIFFIKAYTPGGTVPFCLQAREVDEIDSSIYTVTAPGKNRIINGVEMDQYNKPVAYWIKTITPDGLWLGQSERIIADKIIFLFKKQRPSQTREMSQLARTANRVRDINEYVEALSVKERILACLAVFIKKAIPGSMGRSISSNIDPKSGYQTKTLAPGMIEQLQPGDDVSVVSPSGQSSNAKDFIAIQQRLAGAGQGLSYEAASRDMSQVNYSSARQGLLEDQRTYSIEQQELVDHFGYEVYTEFIISAVLSGKLDIKDFWTNKERYLRHEWVMPGWSWIDPLKEVRANSEALATGQTTYAQICASSGQDWRQTFDQLAKEQKYAQDLGITLGVDKNATQEPDPNKPTPPNGDSAAQDN